MRAVAGRRRSPVAKTAVPGEAGAERSIASVINRSWPVLDAGASSELAHAMIAARNADGYLAALPWSEFITTMGGVVAPMAEQIGRVVRAASGDVVPGVGKLSFLNQDAVSIKYAEQQSGKLIQAITESQRAAIRSIMGQALSGQYTVDQAARMVRGSIGLHPAWAEAVAKYQNRTYARLMREGMSPAKAADRAESMGLRYRNRLIRSRADTIARTEIQTSSNLGRFATWAQMIGSGVAKPSSQKEWSPGPGACDKCAALAGQTVGWDQAFSNGQLMPPAHPNCRCSAVLIPARYADEALNAQTIDWLSPILQDPAESIGAFDTGDAALAAAGSDPFGMHGDTGEEDAAPDEENYSDDEITSAAANIAPGRLTPAALAEEDQATQDLGEAVTQWTQGQEGMDAVRTGPLRDTFTRGLASAPKQENPIYRGLFPMDGDMTPWENMSRGDVIPIDTAASFTTSQNIAREYMFYDDDEEATRGVMMILQDGQGLKVGKLGGSGQDGEVITGHDLVVKSVRRNPEGFLEIHVGQVRK